MSGGYLLCSVLVMILFGGAVWASYTGYGLTTDAAALAQARERTRSVRGGSIHTRSYYGGGPGFGK